MGLIILALYIFGAAVYGSYMFHFWRHNTEPQALRITASICSGVAWPIFLGMFSAGSVLIGILFLMSLIFDTRKGAKILSDNENKTNAQTIKLPDLLPCPFCDGKANIIAEIDEPDETPRFWHVSCDKGCVSTWTTGVKAVSVKTWNTRNEADALRAEVEALKSMVADIQMATFFFPNEPGGHLGTNADISFSRGEYHYHLSGDLPGIADTFAEAYAAIKPKPADGDGGGE